MVPVNIASRAKGVGYKVLATKRCFVCTCGGKPGILVNKVDTGITVSGHPISERLL